MSFVDHTLSLYTEGKLSKLQLRTALLSTLIQAGGSQTRARNRRLTERLDTLLTGMDGQADADHVRDALRSLINSACNRTI